MELANIKTQRLECLKSLFNRIFNRKSNAYFCINISHDSCLSAAYICLRSQKAKINLIKNLNMFSQHPAWVISPVTQWKYGLLLILL